MTLSNHTPKYHRILVKLSGEALVVDNNTGIDIEAANGLAATVKTVYELGVHAAVVIGAGNLWRGKDGLDHAVERASADHMGMIATVMNALALADALERIQIDTRVQTAIETRAVAEPYIRKRAIRHLEKDRVVFLATGTGNSYFTTDMAAALRAMEIDDELLVKATRVDRVYDADPYLNPNAKRFETITYFQALNLGVAVMDSTALTLCMGNQMPILGLNLWQDGSLRKNTLSEQIGTSVN